jgi:hypothetical protein
LIFVIAGSISGYMMWPTSPPNGWQPLLTRQPEELIPSMGARETWSFDSTRQRVSMDSRSTTMLRLGESQHGAFKLQVAISKNTLSGRSGLLIGHRPQHSDGGRRWGCQIVFVDCGEDGRVTVQRESIDLEELRNGTMVLGRYKLATAHVPREPINQSVLEVDVRGNRIQEVRWQGRPLPELADPKTDRSGAVPTCIGQFGIVNNRGSAFFSDARIFIFRRNPL